MLVVATSLLIPPTPSALLAARPSTDEDDGANAPEVALLRARVKEFWQAVGVHDIVKRYELTTPTVRKWVTLEAYRRTWSWEQRPEFPLQSILADLAGVCSCVKLRLLRCTVSVNLAIDRAGQPRRDVRTLQTWEFADGQWYEAHSGAPVGRHCPGKS
jgi:hypothetical protein